MPSLLRTALNVRNVSQTLFSLYRFVYNISKLVPRPLPNANLLVMCSDELLFINQENFLRVLEAGREGFASRKQKLNVLLEHGCEMGYDSFQGAITRKSMNPERRASNRRKDVDRITNLFKAACWVICRRVMQDDPQRRPPNGFEVMQTIESERPIGSFKKVIFVEEVHSIPDLDGFKLICSLGTAR